MSQKLWVQHNTAGKTFIEKVSIQECEDVADFLKEIKKESQRATPSKNPKRLKLMLKSLLLYWWKETQEEMLLLSVQHLLQKVF
jgi:glutamine synthetase adenylyltransferase